MFIGHFAVGFTSKKFAPRASLAVLMAAPLWADILWPVFVRLGWEHVSIDPQATRYTPLDFYDYPWSHSLLMLVVWATAFALVYWAITRYRAGAYVIWLGVVSHWVLDWIAHRPDMPLWPGGPTYGLGLWNSIAGTMTLELTMLAVGVWVYARMTRALNWMGLYPFVAFVAVLTIVYFMNSFGSPPRNVQQLTDVADLMIIVVLVWTWWFDHYREVRQPARVAQIQ
jgi:membrane-bound metal-dependent hydrolase YbcI (DUF457 family)